ncbi:MAG: PP0621 family protein [Telluria sp.]
MSRLLFWIAFIVLVVMAVRSKLREAAPRQAPRPSPRPSPAPQVEAEPMACCGQCGVYFPASESVRAGGRDYCCAAHASQSPR